MTVKSFVPVLCAISQLESPRRLCRNMYISASVSADLKREKDTSKRFLEHQDDVIVGKYDFASIFVTDEVFGVVRLIVKRAEPFHKNGEQ